MATSNFKYAPGVPGYGSKGTDGSTGLQGSGTYFSSYNGKTDQIIIKQKIQTNQELFTGDSSLPGWPVRTYQTGDIFIDKNARIFQINLEIPDQFEDKESVLNTSEFFEEGPIQADAPNFHRYSNSYSIDKKIIDIVYSNNYGDWTDAPEYIYGASPRYYAQTMLVDSGIVDWNTANFGEYFPFQLWRTDSISDSDSIALSREHNNNIWHLGNLDNSDSVRNVKLSLDFNEINLKGEISSSLIPVIDVSLSLGSASNRWHSLYAPNLNTTPLSDTGNYNFGMSAYSANGQVPHGEFGFYTENNNFRYHYIGPNDNPIAKFYKAAGVELNYNTTLMLEVYDDGVNIKRNLNVTEDVSINDNLYVGESLDVGTLLTVSGTIEGGVDLTIVGVGDIGGRLDVGGNTDIKGTLDVAENVEFAKKLTVTGDALFESDVEIRNKITGENQPTVSIEVADNVSWVINAKDGEFISGTMYDPGDITLTAGNATISGPGTKRGGDISLDCGNGYLLGALVADYHGEVLANSSNVVAKNFILASDIRLKENIESIIKSEEIDETKIVQFNFKNDKSRLKYGVIAQELEKTHPEMVFDDREGFKRVNYTEFLLAKVDRLERRLSEIENKL